jgi:sulfoacetaldehyde acetyltransferase
MTMGQGGFQEVPQMAVFEDMVAYQEEVLHPSRMAEVLNRVILQAKQASAPAQINVPRDFWTQVIDIELPPSWSSSGRPAESRPSKRQRNFCPAPNSRSSSTAAAWSSAMPSRPPRPWPNVWTAPVCCGYQHNDAFPGQPSAVCRPAGVQRLQSRHGADCQGRCGAGPGHPAEPFSTLPGYGIDYWPADAAIIQVDINPDRIGLTKPVTVGIAGDAGQGCQRHSGAACPTAGDAGRDAAGPIAETKAAWAKELDHGS